MLKRIFGAAVAMSTLAMLSLGCATTGMSNEQRLDEGTKKGDASKSKDYDELIKLKCDELQSAWAKIRDEGDEVRQLSGYADLLEELKSRSAEFEKATSRNPDLLYQEGGQQLVDARERCTQMSADVTVELDGKIRGIVALPVVDDVRGGKPVKVARINLDKVKDAIEKLNPDDKGELLDKIAAAEKVLGVTSQARKRDP